jgi:phage protein D
MAITSLYDESISHGGFYVPRFQVKIDGANLPKDILYDVLSVTYTDSVDSLDTFTLDVNNWDDSRREFKFIGSERPEQLVAGKDFDPLKTLFEPCNKTVEIRMGYGADLVTMIKGHFTTMAPTFNDGPPRMSVTGLNVLHELRRKQYSGGWENKTDSEIAKNIAQLTDHGAKRFPLPIVTEDGAVGREKKIDMVTQKNQYDIDFLWSRARQRGYVVAIQEATSTTPRQLYFGRSNSGTIPGLREVTFQLDRGKTLVEFTPKITTANQVKSVTVRGWHRTRKQLISRKVTLDDISKELNPDLARIVHDCDAREEVVVDEPVFTNCQAFERAKAILISQFRLLVTAKVKCVGLPDLRAGQYVQIGGLGSRLSGRYFITGSTHRIGDDGYTTEFDCRREDIGGGKAK